MTTKAIIKIHNKNLYNDDSYVTCQIYGSNRNYSDLKLLEANGFFEKIATYVMSDAVEDNNKAIMYAIGYYPFKGSITIRGFAQNKEESPLKPKTPKITSVVIGLNANKTIKEVEDFFKDYLDCEINVVNDYQAKTQPNMTLRAYADEIHKNWLDQVFESRAKITSDINEGKIPDIENYNEFVHDNIGQERRNIVKKGTEETNLNWQVTLDGREEVELAICDAIRRMEELDDEDNLPKCPITLTPIEGHEKAILIISKNPKDGALHASFVHHEDNIEDYLRNATKRDPLTNNDIVAMEIDSLDAIKGKYRKHINRPSI